MNYRRPMFHFAKLPEFEERKVVVGLKAARPQALAARVGAERVAVRGGPAVAFDLGVESSAIRALSDMPEVSAVRSLAPQRAARMRTFATATVSDNRIAMESAELAADPLAGFTIVDLKPGVVATKAIARMSNLPQVESAELLPRRYLCATPAVRRIMKTPPAASSLWNLRKIKWDDARTAKGTDATTIKIAVLDTGIDAKHPDLKNIFNASTNYHWKYAGIASPTSEKDIVGHGTHVSGIIAAEIGNSVGIDGICQCDLSVWKIFSDEAQQDEQGNFDYFVDGEMYLKALRECILQNIDVINLSIGGPGAPSVPERAAFTALVNRGVTICAAMGNEALDGNPTSYPAAIKGVVAVGATTINDDRADFSCTGKHIALCAPGVGIWSTLPSYPGQFGFFGKKNSNGNRVPDKTRPMARERNYADWDGTSMATPHVTGAVAVYLALNGKISPADVKTALMNSADRTPGMGSKTFTSDYGAGRLNLLSLLS